MSKPGHNSGKGGPFSNERLKSFIERIEKMIAERDAINGDIKGIYDEAKGVGYDVKTMRKIVSLRAMDAADRSEAETLLDVYKHALGMETAGPVTVQRSPEVTEEELEERAGRIAAEVDRCMDLVTDGQPPGIYAIQGLIGCSTGKASKLRGMVADRISRSEAKVREMKKPPVSPTQAYIDSFAAPKPEDGDDGITESCGAQQGGGVADSAPPVPRADATALPHDTDMGNPITENESPATPSVGAVASESERVAPPYPDDDPGPPPSFLRRTPAQGRA